MTYKIRVHDMHCERCAERITNALNQTGINFSVDLKEKTVAVDGCNHCLKTALSELEDLGFAPEEITE